MAPSPTPLILISALTGCAWAYYQFTIIEETKLDDLQLDTSHGGTGKESARLYSNGGGSSVHSGITYKNLELMKEVYEAINEGAVAFLHAEYAICARFVGIFAILILVLISWCVLALLFVEFSAELEFFVVL